MPLAADCPAVSVDSMTISTRAPAGTAAVAAPLLQRGIAAVTVHETAVSEPFTVM